MSVTPLPSVVSQNTIELHAIGHLRDLGSLRIVRILADAISRSRTRADMVAIRAHAELYESLESAVK